MNKYLRFLFYFIGVFSIFVVIILLILPDVHDHSNDEAVLNLVFMYDINKPNILSFNIIQSLSFLGIFTLNFLFSMNDIIRTNNSFLSLILYRKKTKVSYINNLMLKLIISNILFSIIILFSSILAFILFGNYHVFDIKLLFFVINILLFSSSVYIMCIYIKIRFDAVIANLFYFFVIIIFFALDMSTNLFSILKFSNIFAMFYGSLISLSLLAVSYFFVVKNTKKIDLL